MPKILIINDKTDQPTNLPPLLKKQISDCTVIFADAASEGMEKSSQNCPISFFWTPAFPKAKEQNSAMN